jgi:hypothetical protein
MVRKSRKEEENGKLTNEIREKKENNNNCVKQKPKEKKN